MSISAVVEADLRQMGRSWRLRGLGVAFVFFFTGTAAIFAALGRLPGGANQPGSYAAALVSPLGLLCPLVGVLIGYRAIIGEQSSGTLRILLSLPNGRYGVVLGKFFSRITLVTVTGLLGSTVGYVSLVLFGGSVAVVEYVAVIVLAMLLQATFIAIGIGLSAGSNSEPVAVAAGLGSVLLFKGLWQFVVRAFEGFFTAVGGDSVDPSVTQFASGINPVSAFAQLTSLMSGTGSRIETTWGEWWFAVVVLLCWSIVPLLIGMWRFERAELA